MCRLAILVLVALVAGCDAQRPDLRPFVAVSVRYSIQAAPVTPPAPTPDKKQCRTCRGTGILGDGRVKITCGACNGTGIEPASVLAAPPAPDCKDGKCPTPTTRR